MAGISSHPETVLNRAQCRILIHRATEVFVRFALIFFTAAVVSAAIFRAWTGHLPPSDWGWWTFILFGIGWLVWTALVFPKRLEVARRLDRVASFKDRLVTYLEFIGASPRSVYQELALAQNSSEIAKLNVARICPLRPPSRGVWLVLPAICFVNLLLFDHFSRAPIIRDPALEQALAAKSVELKKLAEELKTEAEARKLEEVAKIAREMQKVAEQIKPRPGVSSEELKKNALLEWSRLEAKLSELSKAGPNTASGEMRDLASALEQDQATGEMAKMLKQGDLNGALQALQAMMKQAESDPAAAQQMKDMAQRMAQMPQMSSEQMAEMMKQMREAASSGQQSQMQKAMQSFSQMLSGMEKSRQQSR
ncbi:MAG TPA: hypothetical protein VD713_07655, partial [Sphingomonadales bacterium]|nr:hypothetical protein [Sphingomonadales bacterium]